MAESNVAIKLAMNNGLGFICFHAPYKSLVALTVPSGPIVIVQKP